MGWPDIERQSIQEKWLQAVYDYTDGHGSVGLLVKYGTELYAALNAREEEVHHMRKALNELASDTSRGEKFELRRWGGDV